jgi:hypothetical protein
MTNKKIFAIYEKSIFCNVTSCGSKVNWNVYGVNFIGLYFENNNERRGNIDGRRRRIHNDRLQRAKNDQG